MRVFSLRLAGAPIEDAFIYRTSLYCWTFERRLRIYAVSDIEAAAEAVDAERGALINYVLFHSRGFGASPDQQWAWDRWLGVGDDAEGPELMLDGEEVPHVEVRVHAESDALLDMLMYYDRLYLATDGGLFSVAPIDTGDLPTGSLKTDRRVHDSCYSASAGLGTIAASCGPKGLRLIVDDFRWTSGGRRTRKVSDESIRAEIGYGSVVNHRSRFDSEFFVADIEDTPKGRVLVSTRKANTNRTREIDRLPIGVTREIDYSFWDRGRLVIFDDGAALSVGVVSSDDERRLNRVHQVGAYRSIFGRVISAARVGQYFAVESDESIGFISDDDARRIETGPVVSMRTYPNSRRYLRLTTATSSEGLWMLGLGY